MKKLLSIFLFSFLLSNCSSIAVIGGTSLSSSYIASDIKMIFDVVSLVETGKSTNDHVLSAMVDKDCNLFGLFKNGKIKKNAKICQEKSDDSFVVAANYPVSEQPAYLMDDQPRVKKYLTTAREIQKEKLQMFIHIFN